jgi:hypothetical protein
MRKTLLCLLLVSTAAVAEEPASTPKKLVIDVDLAMANVNDDSLFRTMGRERVTKLPYAVVGLSGDIDPHLRYRLDLNAVDDTRRPQPFTPTDKTPFFFPNQGDPGYGVLSRPEGQFMVDDYKNAGLDPYLQQQHLRQGFIDAHTTNERFGVRAGRFVVPVGLALDDVHWFTAKDIAHIQMINAVADTGVELRYVFGAKDGIHGRASAAAVTGNGSPYHDYVYFDFTGGIITEDTNSALGAAVSLSVSPVRDLDVVASGWFNFVGSRIESDPTLSRSKHYDNKLVLGARYTLPMLRTAQVFGEYARYKWGLRISSAELFSGPPVITPINKSGYFVGADVGVPLPGKRGTAGVVVIREELDRDDSLVAFLAVRNRLGVTLGKKERTTILKLYATLGPVTVFAFHNGLDNPFPQASAIVATSGPFAFAPAGNAKTGVGFRFRATF